MIGMWGLVQLDRSMVAWDGPHGAPVYEIAKLVNITPMTWVTGRYTYT